MQCLGNVVGQVLGAMVAVGLLRVMVPHAVLHGGHLAATVLPEGVHVLRAFIGAALSVTLRLSCAAVACVAFPRLRGSATCYRTQSSCKQHVRI